jgi:hypothetical protein
LISPRHARNCHVPRELAQHALTLLGSMPPTQDATAIEDNFNPWNSGALFHGRRRR